MLASSCVQPSGVGHGHSLDPALGVGRNPHAEKAYGGFHSMINMAGRYTYFVVIMPPDVCVRILIRSSEIAARAHGQYKFRQIQSRTTGTISGCIASQLPYFLVVICFAFRRQCDV